MERKMFDTPVLPRLATILAELHAGDLAIPEFQRPFVWDDDHRLRLLDSIAQGMPIGSLLVWRTSKRELHTYDSVGGVRLDKVPDGAKISYLIDGHQRLTTLFGALYSGPKEQVKDEKTRWPIFYELGTSERPAFRLPPSRGRIPSHWLPMDILLDGDKLFERTQQLRLQGRRDLASEAEKLANVFRDYIIPIVPLVTDSLDIVTDAFVRINSLGKAMSEAHMLRALTYLQPIDAQRHFDAVRVRLEPLGWGELDDAILVSCLKAILGVDVYAASVRDVRDSLQTNTAPLDSLADALEEAVEVLAQIGVRGSFALPYAYQLVTLAALAARHGRTLRSPPVLAKLERWFWTTTYTEHFSGASGSRIREGIETLSLDLTGKQLVVPARETLVVPGAHLRMDTVRAKAFGLFLAQLPRDAEAQRRRQQRLGSKNALLRLLPREASGDPGNWVIADPAELRSLRDLAQRGQTSLFVDPSADVARPSVDAEEYGIPAEALKVLPDEQAFLAIRSKWLLGQERDFIAKFGLRIEMTSDEEVEDK